MSEMELSVKLRLANEQFVSALSAAVGDFRAAMDALKVSGESAGNSIDGAFKNLGIRSGATIKAEIDKIKASFATLRDSDLGFADKERASLALNARLRELGRELGSVSGQAKESGSAMQQAGQSSQSMSSSLAHAGHIMAELYVAWAALNGAFRLSKSILDAGIGLDKIMAQLQFATGSASGAAGEMAFVRAEAERLGIDVGAAGEGFAKFAASVRGSSLEGQKAREVFSGVADAAKVMQLSADETKGIFLALSQMMAKGKVQAEEFRGQLGDRLPIATSVAAKALGVTTAEFSRMLDAGELVSEDFLPKFAAALKKNVSGALPAAVNTLDAQLARLGNSWTLAMQEIAKSGAMSEVAKIAEELAAKIRAMSESGELQKFGKEFASAMKTAGEAIVGVTSFVVEHAEAIKGLLIVYAELRALSLVKSFADMAVGLIGASTAAKTASASVGGLGKQLALLPARLTIVLGVIITGVELYKQVTGFIDGIIEGQRKIDEAGRKAVSPVDVQYLVRAREARDALEEINKKYFAGSDQSAMATGKIIGDFRKLTVEARGTSAALAEMAKKVDFGNPEAVSKLLGQFDVIKRAGLATGEEIRIAIGGSLSKLSTRDFSEFQAAAIRSFDGSAEGARKLGMALESSMSEAFRRLGGDIEKFRTGIDQATRDAVANLKTVAANTQSSGREVGEAFRMALNTADNRKEVELLGNDLKWLAETGRLSGKDLEDAQTRYREALRRTAGEIEGTLGETFKKWGIKSKESMAGAFAQMVEEFNAIKNSGQASAEGIQAAYDKMKQAVTAAITAMTRETREALEAAKQHTASVQASTDAVKAQASAISAAANAQKAETEYAQASAEAARTGSAEARAKADALRAAADAAQAEAASSQASANASQAAAQAALAQEEAYRLAAIAAKAPTEANIQAAAAAQDVANETAAAAESEKQAASEASALASQMRAAADQSSAMAAGAKDAAYGLAAGMKNLTVATTSAAGFADAMRDGYNSANSLSDPIAAAAAQMNALYGGVVAFGKDGVDAYNSLMEAARQHGRQLAMDEAYARRNEEATRAWESAMNSLRDSSASLADELDRALGHDKEIEDRAYADKKKAIEDQYEALKQKNGMGTGAADGFGGASQGNSKADQEAEAAYKKAMSDLDKLHKIKLKSIADEKKAKEDADAKAHADSLARINEEKAARLADSTIKNAMTSSRNTASGGTVSGGTASGGITSPAASALYAPAASYSAPGASYAPSETVRIQFLAPGGQSTSGQFSKSNANDLLNILKAAGARAA